MIVKILKKDDFVVLFKEALDFTNLLNIATNIMSHSGIHTAVAIRIYAINKICLEYHNSIKQQNEIPFTFIVHTIFSYFKHLVYA